LLPLHGRWRKMVSSKVEVLMAITVTIRDQTASGDTTHSMPLEFSSERITVRDLIRERVYQEVHDYNRKTVATFQGLIQPSESELILNGSKPAGYRRKAHKPIDWKQQFSKALEAFGKNGFFILVDDKQAEELDQEVIIGRDTEVSFVKLMPMVGG
jgi:hypothetical protein